MIFPCCRTDLTVASGRIRRFGVWRSLVAHLFWEQGVQGSNPCAPTTVTPQKSFALGPAAIQCIAESDGQRVANLGEEGG